MTTPTPQTFDTPRRICRRCLLRDAAEADRAMISKYKSAIKQADRTDETEYERRLALCLTCDRLNAGTCQACGCYVELRAAARAAHCPYHQW